MSAPAAQDVANEMAGLDLPEAVPEIVPGETNAGVADDHAVEPPTGGRPEIEAATNASDHAPAAPPAMAPAAQDVANEMAGLDLPEAVPEIVPGETNAGVADDHAVEPPTGGMPEWLPMIFAEHIPEDPEDDADEGEDLLDMFF